MATKTETLTNGQAYASVGASSPAALPASPCWDKARELFLDEVRTSRRFSEVAITDFLNNNFRVDKAINSCVAMKTKADQAYNGTKQSRFAGKLLNVLRTVKEVGDVFLECAPESVSIAWGCVSMLIMVGTDDLDKCELISGCCENIVTIVLNCRLYENRYHLSNEDRRVDEAIEDIEKRIFEAIPRLLYLILDFSWHTQYHLDKNRLLRSFKETFSNTLKGKIDAIVTEYQTLRSMAEDAFQERVLEHLSHIASTLNRSISDFQMELFPAVQDLTIKLDTIDAAITTRFTSEDLKKSFGERRRKFNPSETHTKMFISMFEPIRDDYKHMSLWLFDDKNYREWEDLSSRTTSLLCLKGPRGFGKSVKMTCVVKRLMEITNRETAALVLFWYFKKGDDTSQYALRALESLIIQLLDQKVFVEDLDLMKQCLAILEGRSSTTESTESAETSKRSTTAKGKGEMISPENIISIFQKIAALLQLPVYVVVDAVDECEDRITERLMQHLKSLSRTTSATIKVICSARDNVKIESLLYDTPDDKAAVPEEPMENSKDDLAPLPDDIKTVSIDENNNATDLRTYLMKKVESIVLRRVGGRRGDVFDQELEKIVDIIQKKANGNFTYAGMVVANLQQPTKSTLESKLSQLPPAMEGMYRRSLEVLTPDEQSLVIFALKWVVWGVGPVSMLEIVEHYKELYRPKFRWGKESSGTAFPSLERRSTTNSVPGQRHTIHDSDEDKNTEHKEEQEEEPTASYDPETDPEVADTKFHLRSAGRDFFQFDDVADSIDVHLSVREWIQTEAEKFEESMSKPAAPIFVKNETGQWILSLPIPATVAQQGQNLTELTNKKEANLSIAIDMLYALNNKDFQDRYMPWNPPDDFVDDWETLWGPNAKEDEDPKELEPEEEKGEEARGTEEEKEEKEEKEQKEKENRVEDSTDEGNLEEKQLTDQPSEVLPDAPEVNQGSVRAVDFATGTSKKLNEGIPDRTSLGSADVVNVSPIAIDCEEGKPNVEGAINGGATVRGSISHESNTTKLEPSIQEPEKASSPLNGKVYMIKPLDAFLNLSAHPSENAFDNLEPTESNETDLNHSSDISPEGEASDPREPEAAIVASFQPLEAPEMGHATDDQNSSESSLNLIANLIGGNSDIRGNQGGSLYTASNPYESKSPRRARNLSRYEILNLFRHLEMLQEEWKEEERIGKDWDCFWEQLELFFMPKNFKRWVMACRISDQESENDPLGYSLNLESPMNQLSSYGLSFILDYCMQNGIFKKRDINCQRGRAGHCIYAAVFHNEFLEALIKYGADVDASEGKDSSALSICLRSLDYGIFWSKRPRREIMLKSIKQLILAGADLKTAQGWDQKTPLHRACGLRDIEMVELMLSRLSEADLKDFDKDGEGGTPMHSLYSTTSCSIDDYELQDDFIKAGERVFELLLKAGFGVNDQNYKSQGPLALAALSGEVRAVELLLQNSADVHDDDVSGRTSLHEALGFGRRLIDVDTLKLVQLLIDAGIDVGKKTKNGSSALASAVKMRETDSARILLEAYEKQNPDDKDYLLQQDLHGRSLLYRCAANSFDGVDAAKLIVEKLDKENISRLLNLCDSDRGYSPLHVAAEWCNVEMIEYLLSLDADVATKAMGGQTAAQIALSRLTLSSEKEENTGSSAAKAVNRSEECLLKLLTVTPESALQLELFLHNALKYGAVDIIRVLSEKKVDLYKGDRDGWTVFHSALQIGDDAQNILRTYFPDYPHDHTYQNLPKAKTPTRLSSKRKGALGELDKEGLEFWSTVDDNYTETSAIALTNHPVPADVEQYYFEVAIGKKDLDENAYASVGFQTTRTNNFSGWVGWDNGVGFHGDSGLVHKSTGWNAKSFQSPYGPEKRHYGEGADVDTVGCGLDTRRGYVWYTLNGIYLGIATTIPRKTKYYPAVSVSANCHLRLNFGGTPFLFDKAHEPVDVLGL